MGKGTCAFVACMRQCASISISESTDRLYKNMVPPDNTSHKGSLISYNQ